MSLLCDESGRDIMFGEPLRSGTRGDVKFHSALSQDVLGCIPESEKRPTPCEPNEGGVDIHESTSPRNFNGSYCLGGFIKGDFLYSISQQTAEKYLPHHIKRY